MKNIATKVLLTLGFAAMVFATATMANAEIRVSFAYHSAPADVRVWLDRVDYDDGYYRSDYDVYHSVDDIVLSVRASRNTYAAVYVVDTEGFVHVVHPFAPGESAFLFGGRVYQFSLGELGFEPWQFERGLAFAYAVTSPVPFSFASYDVEIFGSSWGLRVSGDPYVASKRFYASLVPGYCDDGLIGVSYARFYVREYVRYPSYLCAGWHDYHGVRTYCRSDCSIYRSYRVHASDPYRILHPKYRFKGDVGERTHIRTVRYADPPQRDVRPRADKKVVRTRSNNVRKVVNNRQVRAIEAKAKAKRGTPEKPIVQERTVYAKRQAKLAKQQPVRSSKGDYVRGKKNIVAMRDELKRRAAAQKISQRASNKASVGKSNRKSGQKSKRSQQVAEADEQDSKRTKAASKSSKKRKGAR